MIAQAGAAFDQLAARYDELWSETAIGRQQRAAVWGRIDPLFRGGCRVLEIGCGTGMDAIHLMERGVAVYAIDASKEMVRMARLRGVDAHHLEAEDLGLVSGTFDGAISNFGALNCVSDLDGVAPALGRLVRSGGHVAICVAGTCCAWETVHYLVRGEYSKAFRRWNPRGCDASIGVHVNYPSVRRLARVFRQDFRLSRWYGIGLCVPPSYVSGISETNIGRLAAIDRRLAHQPALRAFADHRLLVFQRV